jgi:MFS family permease
MGRANHAPRASLSASMGSKTGKDAMPPTATNSLAEGSRETPTISQIDGTIIETDIPARLDRLPWSNFHWLVVLALGITWILDGLEVTLAGTLVGAIKTSLKLSAADVELANSAYLVGATCGALYFGWLTDRLGRKKLFFVTLIIYMAFTAATAFSSNILTLALFRFLTGAGIGGEYAAINSAIQELIPARYRGRTDLAINGSFWIGAALGAAVSIVVLDETLISSQLGWRVAFLGGAVVACFIYHIRQWIPESPRWLMTHHRADEGAAIVELIEEGIRKRGQEIEPVSAPLSRLRGRRYTPLREVMLALFTFYRRRTLVGFSLMAAQAFFYNAIFFTYPLVLTDFFKIRSDQVGWYILPFAVGNFCGPLMLGWLFDTVGRRLMIALTYTLSGTLLAASGALFVVDAITATQQTAAWMVVFFFASAAASSAYLTVSEIFPLEIRALAIAVFFALGTGIGGALAPWLFGTLIGTGSRMTVFLGYLLGSTLMIGAAIVEWFFGVDAERKGLESVARPLTFTD